MSKHVSPAFAAIVILVAVVIGALYFMYRFRAHEAQWQREAGALQAQADAARRAGRGMGGGNRRPGRMRAGRRGATSGRRGPAPGGGTARAPQGAPTTPPAAAKPTAPTK